MSLRRVWQVYRPLKKARPRGLFRLTSQCCSPRFLKAAHQYITSQVDP